MSGSLLPYGSSSGHAHSASLQAASLRTDALLASIAPNPSSEFRRLTIAHYICSMIKRCFQPRHQVGRRAAACRRCHQANRRLTPRRPSLPLISLRCCWVPQVEAFMFGSVPLRAVLPDGDIDISMFATAAASGGNDGGAPPAEGAAAAAAALASRVERLKRWRRPMAREYCSASAPGSPAASRLSQPPCCRRRTRAMTG